MTKHGKETRELEDTYYSTICYYLYGSGIHIDNEGISVLVIGERSFVPKED